MTSELLVQEHFANTPDGWHLQLKRTLCPSRFAGGHPLLIIPGYGMNAFIFGFHPKGTSMERCLAEAGLEVWSMNLRNTGRSRPIERHARPPSLRAYAELDLRTALDAVAIRSESRTGKAFVIGASLGGSIAYAHLALCPQHRIAGVITVGAPLRWVGIHPALRTAFRSAWLAGKLSFRGTRRMARVAMPIAARVPKVLGLYMNTAHVDLSQSSTMLNTVEDPVARVNKDIARWVKNRDMVLRGINITEAMAATSQPLLLVMSNRDGIVPDEAVLSARRAWGASDVEVLKVGTEADWYAHADLFVADDAPRLVFDPIARWVADRQPAK